MMHLLTFIIPLQGSYVIIVWHNLGEGYDDMGAEKRVYLVGLEGPPSPAILCPVGEVTHNVLVFAAICNDYIIVQNSHAYNVYGSVSTQEHSWYDSRV